MSSATVSRWARRFLLVSAIFLVGSQVGAIAGVPRRTEVVLGLQGFVLLVVFGKAYSLIPSYFERELVWPQVLPVHLTAAVGGTLALALASMAVGPDWLWTAGAVLWSGGVGLFLLVLVVTLRGNLTGSETATGDAKAERQPLDRFANAGMPVALGYLAVGAYELAATPLQWPTLLGGTYPRVAHLLGPGFALLLLFTIGARLLPRFLATKPPAYLARLAILTGAIGPLCLAAGFPAGTLFQVGAILESVAIASFATTYIVIFARSDRDRVGFYGPLAGVLAGLAGVGLGAWFAFGGFGVGLPTAHLRLNVFGLLGLSIVGVVYQFYPPAVGEWPGGGDRLAFWTIVVLAIGVSLAAVGAVVGPAVELIGHGLAGLAGVGYLYLLGGAIRTQTR